MARKRVQLLHDHLRAAALMDQAVRTLIADMRKDDSLALPDVQFNETDVWVLFAMAGWLDQGVETTGVPKSAAALAAQLGFGRERTLIRVRALIGQDVVIAVGPQIGGDKRRRAYLLTPSGRRLAECLFSEVAQLEARIRRRGGITSTARTLDVQQVTLGLCDGHRDTETTKWLDRQRLDRPPTGRRVAKR